jgi:ribosomal protein S18 acetylase RimI-like enzyme
MTMPATSDQTAQTGPEEYPPLGIRRYRPEDEAAVWALHNEALNAVNAHGGNGPWDDDLHHIDEVYLSGGGEFLVGEVAGQIVAMGALRRRDDAQAEVKRMRIQPGYQRRGYGQAMLTALEARARALGYARLCLDTTAGQVAAQALYVKNGYREVRRHQWHAFEVIDYEKTL